MNYTLKLGGILKLILITIGLIGTTIFSTYAQNYVLLDDAAGFQDQASLDELDEYSGLILQEHSAILGDLKIYSYAFYVHDESKSDWDVAKSMARAIDLASTNNYLIIGKSSGANEICRDFHVTLKMPDIYNGCIEPEYYAHLTVEIEEAIRNAYSGNHSEYGLAEKAGLNVFNNFLDEAESCCPSNSCNFGCDPAGQDPTTPEEIMDAWSDDPLIAEESIPAPIIENRGKVIGNIYDFYGLEDPTSLFESIYIYGRGHAHIIITDDLSECQGAKIANQLVDQNVEEIFWFNIISTTEYEEYIYWGGEMRNLVFSSGGDAKTSIAHIYNEIRNAITSGGNPTLNSGQQKSVGCDKKTCSPYPSYCGLVEDWRERIESQVEPNFFEKGRICVTNYWYIIKDLGDLVSGDAINVNRKYWTGKYDSRLLWDFPGAHIAYLEQMALFGNDIRVLASLVFHWLNWESWANSENVEALTEAMLDPDTYFYLYQIAQGQSLAVDRLNCKIPLADCVPDCLNFEPNEQSLYEGFNATDEGFHYCEVYHNLKAARLLGDLAGLVKGATSITGIVSDMKKSHKSANSGAVALGVDAPKFYENITELEDFKDFAKQKGLLEDPDNLPSYKWDLLAKEPYLVLVHNNPSIKPYYGFTMDLLPLAHETGYWIRFREFFNTEKAFDFFGRRKGEIYLLDVRITGAREENFIVFFTDNDRGFDIWGEALRRDVKPSLRRNTEFLFHHDNILNDIELQNHIFIGDFKNVTGCHYRPAVDGVNVRFVDNQIPEANSLGVLKGDIEMLRPIYNSQGQIIDYRWTLKNTGGEPQTFFPSTWDKDKIIEMSASALANPNKSLVPGYSRMWVAESESGVFIRWFEDDSGKVTSIFPEW